MHPLNYKGQRLLTDAGILVKNIMIANYEIEEGKAVEQDYTAIIKDVLLGSNQQVITENLVNPLIPRSINVKGSANASGKVVVLGTNFSNEVITETLTLKGESEIDGNKAFKSISEVHLPVGEEENEISVSVGYGNKLGLPFKLERNTVLAAYKDNKVSKFSVNTSKDYIEGNTILLNSLLNGKQINIYLMVG